MNKSMHLIHHWSDIVYLIFGPFIAAFGITVFYTPAKITSGGAAGIANILYNLFGFDIGLTSLCINIPLIVIGMCVFGIKYGLKTLIGSSLLSFWMSTIGRITNYEGILDVSVPVYVLLSALFGGVLLGTGIGITMKAGCNTGGTDIVAQSIAHYTPIAVGTVSFCFNVLVVGSSGYFIGLEPMLFSIIGMTCSSHMVNYVLTGFGTKQSKAVYIVSDNMDSIAEAVVSDMKKTGTILTGTGVYTNMEHRILLVLVQNHQYQRLLRIINANDPKAFVFVNEAYNVMGKGFAPLKKVADATTAED
jgi:uncharacterized membrane-anchored protein YitT (DUF2179 family)